MIDRGKEIQFQFLLAQPPGDGAPAIPLPRAPPRRGALLSPTRRPGELLLFSTSSSCSYSPSRAALESPCAIGSRAALASCSLQTSAPCAVSEQNSTGRYIVHPSSQISGANRIYFGCHTRKGRIWWLPISVAAVSFSQCHSLSPM